MSGEISELTDRMREIFGLVVESYLDRGLPVGSKALTGSISLSPASIRGVMQELEERGLLTHPHTSAGRIPTESGLRLFVDGIMQASVPDPMERAEIERQIGRDRPIEDALAAATSALSGLSQAAGVVLAPKREMRLKQFSLVPLARDRALAVLVGVEGNVENRVVPLDPGTNPSALEQVTNFVNARLSGMTLAEAEARLRREIREQKDEIDAAAAELVATGLAAWSHDHSRRPVLIIRGQAISSAFEGFSTNSKTGRRSPSFSKARAMLQAAGSSLEARTGCSLCRAPRSSPRRIAGAMGTWSALSV